MGGVSPGNNIYVQSMMNNQNNNASTSASNSYLYS